LRGPTGRTGGHAYWPLAQRSKRSVILRMW
jgi:hypothetical protein